MTVNFNQPLLPVALNDLFLSRKYKDAMQQEELKKEREKNVLLKEECNKLERIILKLKKICGK